MYLNTAEHKSPSCHFQNHSVSQFWHMLNRVVYNKGYVYNMYKTTSKALNFWNLFLTIFKVIILF